MKITILTNFHVNNSLINHMIVLTGNDIVFLILLQVLKFNLTESGMFSVLPWLTMAFSANVGGWIADSLVSKGVSVTIVRKVKYYACS